MANRQVEFIFPRRGVRIPAILLEGLAPRTCSAVWSVLSEKEDLKSVEKWPGKGLMRHARYAGPELFMIVPSAKKKPPVENQTFRPVPGDVMLISIEASDPGLIDGERSEEMSEVALFYDRNADLEVKHAPGVEGRGWVGSRFAEVPDRKLEALRRLGNSFWSEGPERVVLRKKERRLLAE